MKPRERRPVSLSAPASARESVGPVARRDLLLYVEDADENWQVAALRLGRSFELVRAATDADACALVRIHGDQIAAILMDIQLRGSALDGIQLTRLIRGRLTDDERAGLPSYAQTCPVVRVPIIFVTAYVGTHSEQELLAAGGDLVIRKPVDFTALSLALTQVHLTRVTNRQRR